MIQLQLADFINQCLGGDVAVDYVQAPHPAQGPFPHGGDGYEWWSAPLDRTYESGWIGDDGLDASLAMLTDRIGAVKYDGVIGFSQGGGMAHALVSSGIIQTGILFCPVVPSGRQWPPTGSNPGRVLIVTDDSDPTAQAPQFESAVEVIRHDEGHRIPETTRELEKIVKQFLKKI
jgi:hypothetical protein